MPLRRKGTDSSQSGAQHGNGHNGAHNLHHRKHARKQRRRRRMRNIVLAAGAFLAAHHGKPIKPKVTTQVTFTTRPSVNYAMTVRPDPKMYEPIIQEAAQKHGLDPALIRTVMRFESAFRPLAVSPAGAIGLMQLMPEVAKELGVRGDPFDPYENIMAGAKYLRALLDRHHGKVDLALASYNAGPGAVARYRGIPPYPETRRYVKKITGFMAKNRTHQGD